MQFLDVYMQGWTHSQVSCKLGQQDVMYKANRHCGVKGSTLQPLLLCVLRQVVHNKTEETIKKYPKKICINCETL